MEVTVDAVPDGIVPELRRFEAVVTATATDGTIGVELDDQTAKIDVINHVDERASIENVMAEEASLEAMFKRYANGADETAGESDATDSEAPAAEVTP
jgi:ABC-2 type transport system ATP-binding protein